MKRPPWLTVLAVVLLVLGGLYAAAVFLGPDLLSPTGIAILGWHSPALVVLFLATGAVFLASGVGIFKALNWARLLFFLGLPCLVVAYIAIFPYTTPEKTEGLGQDIGYALVLYIAGWGILGRQSAKKYFGVDDDTELEPPADNGLGGA
jgi:hypothetical protein